MNLPNVWSELPTIGESLYSHQVSKGYNYPLTIFGKFFKFGLGGTKKPFLLTLDKIDSFREHSSILGLIKFFGLGFTQVHFWKPMLPTRSFRVTPRSGIQSDSWDGEKSEKTGPLTASSPTSSMRLWKLVSLPISECLCAYANLKWMWEMHKTEWNNLKTYVRKRRPDIYVYECTISLKMQWLRSTAM